MENLLQDLRYGARMLVKNPGFAAVAILTLALGIGASTAIFSVVNGVLLRPLPFPDPDRVVTIFEDNQRQGWPEDITSFQTFSDWRSRSSSFQEMACYQNWNVNLTGAGEPEGLAGMIVTTRFFKVLGRDAMLGRTIVDGEDQQGHDAVAVLSHAYWTRRFGGDKSIIGREVRLNNTPHFIIGVMPADFVLPHRQPDIWVPLTTGPQLFQDRGNHHMEAIARLKPGITAVSAEAELDGIMRGLEKEHPRVYDGFGTTVLPLEELATRDVRPALLVLAGSVLLVLLIACANVANLLLARGTVREREIAVRTALGAGRWRLIRQMLTESILLSLLGGTLGLLLAVWGVDLLIALKPSQITGIQNVEIDTTILLFALGLSVLTGIVFGLVPALRVSARGLAGHLKEGGRGMIDGPRGNRLRRGLVIVEVALSIILLIGAGLLIRSFIGLVGVDPGFRTEELVTFRMVLPADGGYGPYESRRAFMTRFIERLRSIPGVTDAGATMKLPFTGGILSTYVALADLPADEQQEFEVRQNSVTIDFFKTLGFQVVAGRGFTPADRDTNAQVAIINQAMAKRFWPGISPVGRRMKFGRANGPGPWIEVVGVVGDATQDKLDIASAPEVYMPYSLWPAGTMYYAIRTPQDVETVMPSLRRELRAIDPNLPVLNVISMEDRVSRTFADRRFTMLLLVAFAAIALLLASIGIYGLLAYSVAQRTREIGIRIALGAGRGSLLSMVLRQGLMLVVPGVIAGVAVAAALTHLLSSLLFGVSSIDPITFVVLPLILVAVAMVACYIPAFRATRVDPTVALRYE